MCSLENRCVNGMSDYAILTQGARHTSVLCYLLALAQVLDGQGQPGLKRNIKYLFNIYFNIYNNKIRSCNFCLILLHFENKSLSFSHPNEIQVIWPLQHVAVSELGLHDHVR